MNTHSRTCNRISHALRSHSADFFIMDVPSVGNGIVVRDPKPLRRSLKQMAAMDSWDSNENMCFALWELMARNQ